MLVSLTPEFLATQLVCPPGRTRIEFVDRDGVGDPRGNRKCYRSKK